jgi:hypothetical protein
MVTVSFTEVTAGFPQSSVVGLGLLAVTVKTPLVEVTAWPDTDHVIVPQDEPLLALVVPEMLSPVWVRLQAAWGTEFSIQYPAMLVHPDPVPDGSGRKYN